MNNWIFNSDSFYFGEANTAVISSDPDLNNRMQWFVKYREDQATLPLQLPACLFPLF